MPDKYRITTDEGTYEVTVGSDDATPATSTAPSTGPSAVALTAAGSSARPLATAMEDFATSPTAAKTFGAVARGATTAGAVGTGIVTGSPSQVLAAPMEGWAAGKGGYFLAKAGQRVAVPVAKMLDKAAPYAQTLSTLGGAQGVLDLVQMVDPNRKDLGFLGVTTGDAHDPDHPALINAAVDYVRSKLDGWQWSKVKNLVMQKGMDEIAALKQVLAK